MDPLDHPHFRNLKTEFPAPVEVTCVDCGAKGTGYISEGWDTISDSEGDHDICEDCSRQLELEQLILDRSTP